MHKSISFRLVLGTSFLLNPYRYSDEYFSGGDAHEETRKYSRGKQVYPNEVIKNINFTGAEMRPNDFNERPKTNEHVGD
ncbi:MAG: hypothetical protein JO145_03620 [Acidobacteriaceae bacterium]|nr:hypothetical protein [Acidobacteriaceae bacterium]